MRRKSRFDARQRANSPAVAGRGEACLAPPAPWPHGGNTGCLRPEMATFRSVLSVLLAGEGIHAVEQRLRLGDEVLSDMLVDRLAGESGGFEQRGHLAGDAVALGGERG